MDAAQRKLRLIAAASAAAFVLVCALAALFAAPAIEAALQARAGAALAAAGIAGVTATLDGRTATLDGAVTDEAEKAAAIAAVAAVGGIAATVDRIRAGGPAEVPALYRFSATWDGRALTLTGHMPSRDARAETVTHARDMLRRAEIADAIDVAPGAPDENWQAIVAAGLAAMKGLSSATMTLAGPKMTFVGRSPDADGRAEAVRILESLPAPYVSSIDIRIGPEPVAAPPAPPYRFGAAFDGVSVALSGVLPSAAAKAEIAAALLAVGAAGAAAVGHGLAELLEEAAHHLLGAGVAGGHLQFRLDAHADHRGRDALDEVGEADGLVGGRDGSDRLAGGGRGGRGDGRICVDQAGAEGAGEHQSERGRAAEETAAAVAARAVPGRAGRFMRHQGGILRVGRSFRRFQHGTTRLNSP